MEEQEVKKVFAERLTALRKEKKLTQSQLGDILKYSDKSISKWEREEALPDVITLCNLAEYFNVPVNYLISKNVQEKQFKDNKLKKHIIITTLSCLCVWFLAVVIFAGLSIGTDFPYLWLTFIYGVPATFIVLTVFSCLWFNNLTQCISISGLIWGCCLAIFLSILVVHTPNAWLLFTIGAVLQVLCIFWFLLVKEVKKSLYLKRTNKQSKLNQTQENEVIKENNNENEEKTSNLE